MQRFPWGGPEIVARLPRLCARQQIYTLLNVTLFGNALLSGRYLPLAIFCYCSGGMAWWPGGKRPEAQSRAVTLPWTPKQRGDGAAEAGNACFGVTEVPQWCCLVAGAFLGLSRNKWRILMVETTKWFSLKEKQSVMEEWEGKWEGWQDDPLLLPLLHQLQKIKINPSLLH